MLEQERQLFDERLPELLRQSPGRFVIIKNGELIGTFGSIEEALGEGARRFGLEPFLVRQILPQQPEVRVPALALGILYAYPAYAGSGTASTT